MVFRVTKQRMRDEGRTGAIQQQHAAEGDPAPAGERADGHQQQGEHERGDEQGEQFVEVDHGRVLWRAIWAAETVGARIRQIAGV